MFLKDRPLRWQLALLFVFALFSYVISLSAMWTGWAIIWIGLLIVSYLVLRAYLRRLIRYSDPLFLLDRLSKMDCKKFAKGNEQAIYELVDNVAEVAVKAAHKNSAILARHAISFLLPLIEFYIEVASRRAPQEGELPLLDRVNSFTAYLSKSLFWVYKEALKRGLDPVSEEAVTVLGKISLFLCRHHPDSAHLPLLFMEKASVTAIDLGNEEVIFRISATLAELAKNLVLLSAEKNESYQEPIILVLNHLDDHVKKSFAKKSDLSPVFFMQPFAEIGQLFADPRVENVPNRDEILGVLRKHLAEFNLLDLVAKQKGKIS